MHPDLVPTLVKLLLPLLGIAVVLVVTRLRGISWSADLALVWPRLPVVALWLAIWIGWVIVGEVAIRTFGLAQAAPWKPYPPLIIVLRILAIGVAGPVVEELIVRGLLFHKIAGTRLGPIGAIVAGALFWALVHVQYDAATLVLIFLDGLVLGLARFRSRSTLVPMVMHSLGNLYSIAQSLGL